MHGYVDPFADRADRARAAASRRPADRGAVDDLGADDDLIAGPDAIVEDPSPGHRAVWSSDEPDPRLDVVDG